MAAYLFSIPSIAVDVFFVAPMFDPGLANGGLSTLPGKRPVTVTQADTTLVLAEAMTNRDLWAEKSGHAVALMAAHLLWLDLQAESYDPVDEEYTGNDYAGAITSESVGPISRGYGAKSGGFTAGGDSAFADDPLAQSPYGKKLLLMQRGLMARGFY